MKILTVVSFLSMGLPIFILFRMFKDNFYSVIPIIVPFIGVTTIGISVAYLETGVYSPELLLTTQQTGGTLRYVLAISVFLLAYWIVFRSIVSKQWIKQQKKISQKSSNEIINTFMVIIGIGTAMLLLSYVPEIAPTSRGFFLRENPSAARDLILKYLPFVGLGLGIAAGLTRYSIIRIASYAGIILILFALYGFGHKSSAFISFLGTFAIPFLVIVKFFPMKRPVFGIELRGQVICAAIFMLLLSAAGIYRYVSRAGFEIKEYLVNRIFVLQGGVWWFTDYGATHGLCQSGMQGFTDFIKSIDYDRNLSLIYLMTKTVGEDLTNKIVFIHHNLYTGAFPAIFYEIGGITGPVLFSFLSGIIIALTSGYLIRKLIKRQFILIFGAFYIYLPVIAILEGGEFTHLFSTKTIIKLLAIFLLESIYYIARKKSLARCAD